MSVKYYTQKILKFSLRNIKSLKKKKTHLSKYVHNWHQDNWSWCLFKLCIISFLVNLVAILYLKCFLRVKFFKIGIECYKIFTLPIGIAYIVFYGLFLCIFLLFFEVVLHCFLEKFLQHWLTNQIINQLKKNAVGFLKLFKIFFKWVPWAKFIAYALFGLNSVLIFFLDRYVNIEKIYCLGSHKQLFWGDGLSFQVMIVGFLTVGILYILVLETQTIFLLNKVLSRGLSTFFLAYNVCFFSILFLFSCKFLNSNLHDIYFLTDRHMIFIYKEDWTVIQELLIIKYPDIEFSGPLELKFYKHQGSSNEFILSLEKVSKISEKVPIELFNNFLFYLTWVTNIGIIVLCWNA